MSKRQLYLVICFFLLAVLVAFIGLHSFQSKVVYASFNRPDGQYRIVVFKKTSWLGLMPGQASDASGTVELQDRDGKQMRETPVEMVQLVESVLWLDKKVRIKFVVEWDLPK